MYDSSHYFDKCGLKAMLLVTLRNVSDPNVIYIVRADFKELKLNIFTNKIKKKSVHLYWPN